jgi:hypothetical protein
MRIAFTSSYHCQLSGQLPVSVVGCQWGERREKYDATFFFAWFSRLTPRCSQRNFRPPSESPYVTSVTSVRCFPLCVILAPDAEAFTAEFSPAIRIPLRDLSAMLSSSRGSRA